jgi:DNA polymerase I-like protein with 3'-5' exonuclease and polymerase domains
MWAKIFKQDIFFMLTVHDELVCDCPAGQEEYYLSKLIALMERAAKNYLIPAIDMHVEGKWGNTWKK